MHLSAVQWVVVFATMALQVAIITVMVRSKSRSTFPFFFNFIIFSLAGILLRAIVYPHLSTTQCFYLRWTILGAATLLSFAVVNEVFVKILSPYSALVDLGKLLFRWALLFLALASLITALATNDPDNSKILSTIWALTRSFQLMLCGLLLLFVLFQTRLGLSWRSPAICIMIGFGTTATVALATPFLQDHFPTWSHGLDWAGPVTCVAVYSGWFLSFALPQPARSTVQDSPMRLILQRWNEVLIATPLVTRKNQTPFSPIESFLPGVEQTVERVMARKMH